MKSRLLLDVVVRKSAPIFELLASEDKSLLIWWNAFLVLDFSLDIFNGVRGFDFKSDGLSGQSLDKDLHTASKSEDEMESRLFLDVVIRKSSAVFELLASEDKSLLVWGNSFLVLDLGLDVLDGIGSLNLKGDGLARKGLDKDLHVLVLVFFRLRRVEQNTKSPC